MNSSKKFDDKKLNKLNDPTRVKLLEPNLIWKTLNLHNPQTLVDVGAGTGFFATLFCKKMKEGIIYACDTSEVMINWMKQNLSTQTDSKIIPIKSTETTIPLLNGIADLVYLINVFHELEVPIETLAEANRVLKEDGKIAVIDWKAEETPEGPPLSIRVSENLVYENLIKAGFYKIESHKVLPFHYFIIAEKKLR